MYGMQDSCRREEPVHGDEEEQMALGAARVSPCSSVCSDSTHGKTTTTTPTTASRRPRTAGSAADGLGLRRSIRHDNTDPTLRPRGKGIWVVRPASPKSLS